MIFLPAWYEMTSFLINSYKVIVLSHWFSMSQTKTKIKPVAICYTSFPFYPIPSWLISLLTRISSWSWSFSADTLMLLFYFLNQFPALAFLLRLWELWVLLLFLYGLQTFLLFHCWNPLDWDWIFISFPFLKCIIACFLHL